MSDGNNHESGIESLGLDSSSDVGMNVFMDTGRMRREHGMVWHTAKWITLNTAVGLLINEAFIKLNLTERTFQNGLGVGLTGAAGGIVLAHILERA
jgi:hypothetical protein